MKIPRFLAVGFAAFLAFASVLGAQVIFDNTGGATSFSATSGWTVDASQEVAVQFTSGISSFLDFAEVEVWNRGGSVNVGLFSNGAGAPGSLLESVNVALPPSAPNPQGLLHVEFANTTFLSAGAIYWLGVSVGAGKSTAWEMVGATGNVAYDSDIGFGDPWVTIVAGQKQSGMRLVGTNAITAVPEPSTYGLIGCAALIGAVSARRLRKKS